MARWAGKLGWRQSLAFAKLLYFKRQGSNIVQGAGSNKYQDYGKPKGTQTISKIEVGRVPLGPARDKLNKATACGGNAPHLNANMVSRYVVCFVLLPSCTVLAPPNSETYPFCILLHGQSPSTIQVIIKILEILFQHTTFTG
jgi:hypothetical protein